MIQGSDDFASAPWQAMPALPMINGDEKYFEPSPQFIGMVDLTSMSSFGREQGVNR
jgi:hypothetical protein